MFSVNLSRRVLLNYAAMGALVTSMGALTACTTPPTLTEIQQDIETLVNGLNVLVSTLPNLIPADVYAKVVAAIQTIKDDAALILGAVTPDASLLKKISAAVSLISDLLLPFFPAASGIGIVVQAALSLIAYVLGLAGVATATIHARYPVEEARQILQDVAQNGVHP